MNLTSISVFGVLKKTGYNVACTCGFLAFGGFSYVREDIFIPKSTCHLLFEFGPGGCHSGSGGNGVFVVRLLGGMLLWSSEAWGRTAR